ncbi:outer membrane beta-barrel protein [Pseudoalteromonas sp. CST5]|uniref:OmpW/AlkL family protein n=1 Tax=unclassified Pseudoalteromonas TaxID=194690 RepID=UPI00235927F9|nr:MULTISPECIES: OmpW family outer membrane protein [unclassified Pseudoalteromonas]MDC9513460.1 outer membrane beta-barrel protein [Pseudoalteromonas sp. CST1]MDC9537721.1 outer membrane beta-barrel protein [Pseudoalteromonas sp. CST3]MDC9541965.1 outer membrane beta-barrel protein [Pseudoalteromonas sp. CST2]MDC9544685.1 outer membrane beta-barrel protein [Pseudoalteromonas sp. CST4]MDC9549371.1 outer membrane beta-barrel protein [Pseudoalteromonas sp. CST5]
MKTQISIALLTSLLAITPAAHANLSVNVGTINVNPDNSSSAINEAPTLALKGDSDTQLGITIDYAFNDKWVLELIAATPFSHDVNGAGGLAGNKIADIKQLPPSLVAQYHFLDTSYALRPFIGVGLNYTTFFDEQPSQALKATLGTDDVEVKLDDSFGFIAQVGANYKIDQHWGLHAMVSMIDIDTDATVYANGAKALTSTVELDPVVAMFGVRYSF